MTRLWSSDCTNIAQFTHLELLRLKGMRPILTREFSFQLILGFCTLSRSQYWKFYIPIRCSGFFTVTSIMVSKYAYLKMRVSKECFLHVCHPWVGVLFLSSRRIHSFSVIWLCSRMYWHRIVATAAAAFRRDPGFTRIVKATVPRCTLEYSSSFQRCSNLVSLLRDIPR